MRLLQAIKILHNGKKQPLNIVHHGIYFIWDSKHDVVWQNYKKADWFLYSKYKIIYKPLKWVKYF